MPALKKIGLVYHPLNERALAEAQALAGRLGALSIAHWLCSAWEPRDIRGKLHGTDLIVTCGGDGTILRVAQVVAEHDLPILGINLGRLGFMTEVEASEIGKKLDEVISGAGWVEERTMLRADLHQVTGRRSPRRFHALNDVVMARGEIARIVHISADIDGHRFTTYRSDGVVVATATGSTGYSLAAGGPVLHPESGDFILTPIMPHLTMRYPLVLPGRTELKLSINTVHQATLSIDGHISLALCDGDSIDIQPGEMKTRFLRLRPRGYYYRSLDKKLKG
jgi:NAD+ kinase